MDARLRAANHGAHELTPGAALRDAARAGAAILSDPARTRVGTYLQQRQMPDGGFLGRHGVSDLYYSYFALASLDALGQGGDSMRAAAYLSGFGEGRDLDLVHLCCLARSLALLPGGWLRGEWIASRLDSFVAPDGGFCPVMGMTSSSISATFVARLAYEELGRELPDCVRIEERLAAGRRADGGWADAAGVALGTTTVTAAATLMLGALGRPESEAAIVSWLGEHRAPGGGFLASRKAPAPDLLSTAAALLALQALGASRRAFADATLAFIDSLWCDDGGFRGYGGDPLSDGEFTYYALVALGTLAGELS